MAVKQEGKPSPLFFESLLIHCCIRTEVNAELAAVRHYSSERRRVQLVRHFDPGLARVFIHVIRCSAVMHVQEL